VQGLRPQAANFWAIVRGKEVVVRGLWGGRGGGFAAKAEKKAVCSLSSLNLVTNLEM
jgi:hypothetical protein